MSIGILKRFGTGGFGFLQVEGEADIFVHGNQFTFAGLEPSVGAEYEFDVVKGADGRLRARDVHPCAVE